MREYTSHEEPRHQVLRVVAHLVEITETHNFSGVEGVATTLHSLDLLVPPGLVVLRANVREVVPGLLLDDLLDRMTEGLHVVEDHLAALLLSLVRVVRMVT